MHTAIWEYPSHHLASTLGRERDCDNPASISPFWGRNAWLIHDESTSFTDLLFLYKVAPIPANSVSLKCTEITLRVMVRSNDRCAFSCGKAGTFMIKVLICSKKVNRTPLPSPYLFFSSLVGDFGKGYVLTCPSVF